MEEKTTGKILNEDETKQMKQMNEIESWLNLQIDNDTQLEPWEKMTFRHSLAHEMGHVRMAIRNQFRFSYIRVNRYVCYCVDQSSPYQTFLFEEKIEKPNGQCLVFTEKPTKLAYISVLNAGPLATTHYFKEQFKEQLEQNKEQLEQNKNFVKKRFEMWGFKGISSSGNPERDSCLPYYLNSMRDGSDQNSIKRIIKSKNFHEKLNERFKNVHLYMVGEARTLPEGCSKSMRAVVEAIRKQEIKKNGISSLN